MLSSVKLTLAVQYEIAADVTDERSVISSGFKDRVLCKVYGNLVMVMVCL